MLSSLTGFADTEAEVGIHDLLLRISFQCIPARYQGCQIQESVHQ